MQFTLLFYLSPDEFAAQTDPDRSGAYWGSFLPYMQAVRDAGIFVSGAGLLEPQSATTVRSGYGKRLVQDGPFADTKEQLGGLFVIDVPDLDSALEWAGRYPAAAGGGVEVRANRVPPRQPG